MKDLDEVVSNFGALRRCEGPGSTWISCFSLIFVENETDGELSIRVGIKKEDSPIHLSTNVMASGGHVLTHRPQPKHKSGLKTRDPFTISLAPNWHLSTQIPQSLQAGVSVTDILSDVNRCGAKPYRTIPPRGEQQQVQQLQI